MLSADATEISAPQTSSGPDGDIPPGPQLGRPYEYPAKLHENRPTFAVSSSTGLSD